MRGATAARYLDLGADRHGRRGRRKLGLISIHAPHAGRDYGMGGKDWQDRHFNPRAPRGARRPK